MSHIYYLKRCLSVLLACSLLCGLMAFPPAQAAGRQPESGEWFYSLLSDANQEAYDAIQAQVDNLAENSTDPSAVSFTPTAGKPDGAAIFAFFRDHPEYFWIDSSKLVWSDSNGQYSLAPKISGEPFFYEGFDVDTLPNVRSRFDDQVQDIIRGMPSGDWVTQLRYLNNWIAQNNVYNPLGVGASNYSRCAASGILSHNDEDTAPVCYGYATAFKVLLDAADIPNAYIEGWAYNQGNSPYGEQHAWNYVKVNETWYAIDPTWDDPKLVSGQARFHYFLVGSETKTEIALSGKEQFGQNHEVTKSPANIYKLSYPSLSQTASDQVVTTGFELIQGDTSTEYSTLEEALSAAQNGGGTVKLWQPITITKTLTIPDGVTLDLNGQNSNQAVSSMAVAVTGSITGPLFTITQNSDVSIVNSGNFTSLKNNTLSTCIQNNGALTLGNNLALTPGVLGDTISGNTPELAPQSYQFTNSSSKVYNVYLVAQPESPKSGSYSAQKGDTVQQLLDDVSSNKPSLQLYYYTFQGKLSPMVAPTFSWTLGRSPNDGNLISLDDPLENGDYIFIAQVYDYAVPYTVTVSGVPDAPKQYTVTVDGGDGATGAGEYAENEKVTVSAGTKEGYTFQRWMAEGVTLDDDTQSTVSFIMPAKDVTLTANFARSNTVSIAAATLVPKTYDGTTAAAVESVTFNGGTPIKDIDYTAAAVFDDADAGTGKTAIVTVTLLNGNYTFADGKTTASYTLHNQTIDKATYSGETTVLGFIRANTAAEVSLPQLPDGATFGNPVYSVASDTVVRAEITGNTFSYEGGSGIVEDTEYTVTVPVNGGKNYNDYDLTVILIGTDKKVPTGAPTLSTTTITYGQPISTITLSGSMEDGEDTVAGIFVWDAPETTPNAGSYEAQWTFTPDNGDLYVPVSSMTTITVNKATPTGAPQYTPITTSGKTLADARLTAEGGTFSVAGTVVWEQPDTTQIQANTSYKWIFTPTDSNNYNALTGSIELWYQGASGGGGGSSGGGSSNTTTETTTNPDGSTITTVTKPDGSVTETIKHTDGSTEVVETQKDGTMTTTTTDAEGNKTVEVQNTDGSSKTTIDNKDGSGSVTAVDESGKVVSEATLSESTIAAAQAAGEAVTLPMPELPLTTDRESAPMVNVNLPASSAVKVEIPVKNVTAGTVAILVKEDGTEEVIKTSLTTDTGVAITLSDGDTVKIVDNSKDFADVSGSYWGADAIDFATSRELFLGTSETTFSPEAAMTRAMIVTVLARYEGMDTSDGDNWYDAGRAWAMQNGVSDGSNMEQSLTREQLATMLYRYAGEPVVIVDLRGFTDRDSVSNWAQPAMAWAVKNGILTGTSTATLSPQDTATRAQVATILMRFCQLGQ